MKSKIQIFIVITLIFTNILMLTFSTAVVAHTEGDPSITDLIAGGGNEKSQIDVGDILVWNDADYLYVKYVITEPFWCLVETHLHLAIDPVDIPQKNGNPIPGQFELPPMYFELCTTYEYTYEIPLAWPICTNLYIAAHAIVSHVSSDSLIASATAWGDGTDFDGKNWGMYITYNIQGVEMPEVWPEGGTISVAYEDVQIGNSDWDYNDFVVDIDTLTTFFGTSSDRYLTQIKFTVRPEAKLSGYSHEMHLEVFTSTFGGDGTYELCRDGSLVESGVYDDTLGKDVILVPYTDDYPNEVIFTIDFSPMIKSSFSAWDQNLYHGEKLFYDPYLYVLNTGQYIHTWDVRMLTVPVDWAWPTSEGNAIWNVYPKVTAGTPPTFVPYWWTP